MALGDVIARLSVVLGLDTIAFEKGAARSQKEMAKLQRSFAKTGKQIGAIGKSMSVAITAPVLGAGAAVVKMTGDFESAMNRVSISTQGTAAEMKAMSDLALKLGKDTTFGATDAADAMDMLAKNGLSATEILNGAADAAVNLAMAGGAELAPAADAITDVMQQFKLTTADLPTVVDQITGAVNESKLDFEDFAAAIGQAGGVAGASGVEFDDFNAAIAATSALFASGSDAGTSFKTFLTRLTPDSKQAREAIEELGLQFFDAQGNMRSMSAIAEELRTKLAGLSEGDRTATLKTIFGTDAMRTAIGLMDQGAAGIDTIKAKIAETDAAAQSAKRLEGFNGQMENLSGAVETLAVRIGQSGLLDALTSVITKLADWIDALSETNPELLKWGTIIAGVVAVVGPFLIVIGAMVSAVGTLLPVITAVGSAIGVVATVITTGAIPAIGAFIAAFAPILIPLAAVAAAVLAVKYAFDNWDKIKPVLNNLASAVSSWWTANVSPVLSAAWDKIKLGAKIWWDLHVAAVNAMMRLTQGVRQWIVDKLGAVWGWLKGKLEAVGGWFFDLYDKVVGHSYVPDMVDEIGQHMQRLDGLMVDPARKATRDTAEAFRDLAGEVRSLMDRLFPEFARLNAMREDLAVLDRGAAAGLLSPEMQAEAYRRARRLGAGLDVGGPDAPVSDGLLGTGPLVNLDDLQKNMDRVVVVIEKAMGRAQDRFGEFSDFVSGAFGSFGYQLEGVLLGAQSAGEALRNLARELASMAIRQFILKPLGGLLGIPGFATGTSYAPGGLALVGERGPELVNLPRGSQVYTNGETMGMLGRAGGGDVHRPTFVFPGVANARDAREAAGQAARRYRREINA